MSTVPLLPISLLALSTVAVAQGINHTPQPSGVRRAATPTIARGEYAALDRHKADVTNPGTLVPFRPVVLTPDNAHLYAVNTHASPVCDFTDNSGQPSSSWAVPWGPVSLAIHDGHTDGVPRLLVVCRGNHQLAALNRLDGTPLSILELPFEPADILVDGPAQRAFVSCPGADEVVEIDLLAFQVVRTFEIPSKEPTFLSFAPDGDVLVAPMLSGNNSTVVVTANGAEIRDLDDPAIAPSGGLPDHDLFRLRRDTGAVEPALRQTGTVLFAQGVNPVTGRVWQLNLNAKNKDPLKQNEPAVNGDFVDNRLTIASLPARGAPPAVPAGDGSLPPFVFVNLDDSDRTTPGVQFDPTRTVSSPWSLNFVIGGFALVCGMDTDNVTALDPQGDFLLEFDVPDGSIPRWAGLDPATSTLALVYCWGTNKVEVFDIGALASGPILSFDLGPDPAPEVVKQGRALFHDASRSRDNHLTCGSCHVDGRRDGIAWNLSGVPADHKGALVTQTLAGIEKLAPFHWRGERRTLKEFNGAFTGLLGASAMLDETPGGEFDRFQAFVFSLANTSNPGQDPRRVLNEDLAPVEANGMRGSAVAGQEKFLSLPSLGALSCNDCHQLPTATNNDMIFENFVDIAQHTHMEVTAFNEMWRKELPIVDVDMGGPNPVRRPVTGFGLLHDGRIQSIFDFVSAFAVTPQDRADITAFVRQFDDGLAPAVTKAYLIDQAHMSSFPMVERLLVAQANAGNMDLAVRGRTHVLGVMRDLSWAYDATTKRFVPNASGLPNVTLAGFRALSSTGLASNFFVGLPLGNARSWIDGDLDELVDLDEVGHGADPRDADTDGDGFLDGKEVALGSQPDDLNSTPNDQTLPVISNLALDWVTCKDASISLDTNEPTKVRIIYQRMLPTVGPSQVHETTVFGKRHRLLLADLEPSTVFDPASTFDRHIVYGGTVSVTDDAGRTRVAQLPQFETASFLPLISPPAVVIGDLRFTSVLRQPGGTMTLAATTRIDFKLAGPPPIGVNNVVVVANVLRNGAVWSNFSTLGPNQFLLNGAPYTLLPGPFVIFPMTTGGGASGLQVDVSGLTPGDEVTLNVVAACYVDPASYDPQAPEFGTASNPLPMGNWSFTDTRVENRAVTEIY